MQRRILQPVRMCGSGLNGRERSLRMSGGHLRPTTEKCLKQIDYVVQAAADPSSAYLIRSRLRRTILSCARLVADASSAPKPDVPGLFVARAGTSTLDRHPDALQSDLLGGARAMPAE